MTASQPRLVFERWTDSVAGEILDAAEIITVGLDLHSDPLVGWTALETAHGYQVATRTDVAAAPNGGQWLVDRNLVARCRQLLAVCSAGAGYDVVDVDACTEAGIVVCNNSGPGAEAVAEHALGLMLDLAKNITRADRALRGGAVRDRSALRGSQLLGKTVGIVGLGAIGGRLLELCAPFGMPVLVFDPYVDQALVDAHRARSAPLADVLAHADFVHITCPLTAETEGLIGDAEFAAMKPGAYFVTTARGRVHDEQALYRALVSGHLGGAGLDVFHDEPPRPDNPLLSLDTVIATPHTAGITVEAAQDIAVATARQWVEIFEGRVPPRLLNPEVWPRFCERFAEAFGFRPVSANATAV